MENEYNLVRVESENGKIYDMIILKEFDYKTKKYAVLMETDSCNCGCNECDCNEDCDCGCNEEHKCTCDSQENNIFILEITKDKTGNEIFKSIEDEKLFDEVVKEADKVLYD